MITTLIFDLDDTLYREADFVASGYRAVARHLADRYRCDYEDVYRRMMTTFVADGRANVFPMVVESLLNGLVPIAELVEVYRRHIPGIRLFPGCRNLLERLTGSYRLGIITDGLPEVQKRKVAALGLDDLVQKIIYTWENGPEMEKPHPWSFCLMMQNLNAAPSTSLFVGDSPRKDCRGAHAAGMKSVCLQANPRNGRPRSHATDETPDFVIGSLHQLPSLLESGGFR